MRDVGHHEAPRPIWVELITDPVVWVAAGLVVLAVVAALTIGRVL